MQQMILGVFSDKNNAENAINDLTSEGLNAKDISIIMKDSSEGRDLSNTTGASVAENVAGGAATGAGTGGVIGAIAGLLIGVGAIAIPGIGGLLIGGPVAAALGLTGAAATTVSGAVTGALAGGLVGALVGLGLPEEDAKYYEEQVKMGAVLLAVPTSNGNDHLVKEILEKHGADQIRNLNMNR